MTVVTGSLDSQCPDYYRLLSYLSLTSLSQKVDESLTIKCPSGKY